MRSVLHKPSFEEEEVETVGNQSWFDRTRGSVILLWIPSVPFFSVQTIDVVQHVGGGISNDFVNGV